MLITGCCWLALAKRTERGVLALRVRQVCRPQGWKHKAGWGNLPAWRAHCCRADRARKAMRSYCPSKRFYPLRGTCSRRSSFSRTASYCPLARLIHGRRPLYCGECRHGHSFNLLNPSGLGCGTLAESKPSKQGFQSECENRQTPALRRDALSPPRIATAPNACPSS